MQGCKTCEWQSEVFPCLSRYGWYKGSVVLGNCCTLLVIFSAISGSTGAGFLPCGSYTSINDSLNTKVYNFLCINKSASFRLHIIIFMYYRFMTFWCGQHSSHEVDMDRESYMLVLL